MASCIRSKSKQKRNYREERRLIEEAEALMDVYVGNVEEITTEETPPPQNQIKVDKGILFSCFTPSIQVLMYSE